MHYTYTGSILRFHDRYNDKVYGTDMDLIFDTDGKIKRHGILSFHL